VDTVFSVNRIKCFWTCSAPFCGDSAAVEIWGWPPSVNVFKFSAREDRESERASFAHILNPQELLEGYRGQGASISLKGLRLLEIKPFVVLGP